MRDNTNSPEQDRESDCKAHPELTGHSPKERGERVPTLANPIRDDVQHALKLLNEHLFRFHPSPDAEGQYDDSDERESIVQIERVLQQSLIPALAQSVKVWRRPLATISEEEIERVAQAIERSMFAPHEMPLSADLHLKYRATAIAAINAAAQPAAPVETATKSAPVLGPPQNNAERLPTREEAGAGAGTQCSADSSDETAPGQSLLECRDFIAALIGGAPIEGRAIEHARELIRNADTALATFNEPQTSPMTLGCQCEHPMIKCDHTGCRCTLCGELERLPSPLTRPVPGGDRHEG